MQEFITHEGEINELIKEMVEAGVHYGHQTRKWNPGMRPYLMKDKGGIHIINLEHTVPAFNDALNTVKRLAENKNQVMCGGTKRAAGEGRDGRDGERLAGLALAGQRIAVKACRHRRSDTGRVDQDRRGRTARL